MLRKTSQNHLLHNLPLDNREILIEEVEKNNIPNL